MLMIILILFYMILSIAGIMAVIVLMINAPEGWEDKDGFHLGKRNHLSFSDAENQHTRKIFLKYYYMPITGTKAHLF
jgi:flagellar basal body-associated protein FliL